MAPANPPLPIPWNFPFQPELGIHTSNLMSESLDGFRTPATRQNAGRLLIGWPTGGVNDPAGTACAVLMVAPGSESVARLSQVPAWRGAAARAVRMSNATSTWILIVNKYTGRGFGLRASLV